MIYLFMSLNDIPSDEIVDVVSKVQIGATIIVVLLRILMRCVLICTNLGGLQEHR